MRLKASRSGVDAATYWSVRWDGSVQRSIDMVAPVWSYHSMTDADGVRSPSFANRIGRSAGFSRRSCRSRWTWANRSFCHGAWSHESQVSAESWQ